MTHGKDCCCTGCVADRAIPNTTAICDICKRRVPRIVDLATASIRWAGGKEVRTLICSRCADSLSEYVKDLCTLGEGN